MRQFLFLNCLMTLLGQHLLHYLVIDSWAVQSWDCPNWHNAVISVFRDKQFFWCSSNSNWKKSETMANCFFYFFLRLNPRAISEMLLDFCLHLVWWGSNWGAWFLLLENGLCSTYLVVTIRGFQLFLKNDGSTLQKYKNWNR